LDDLSNITLSLSLSLSLSASHSSSSDFFRTTRSIYTLSLSPAVCQILGNNSSSRINYEMIARTLVNIFAGCDRWADRSIVFVRAFRLEREEDHRGSIFHIKLPPRGETHGRVCAACACAYGSPPCRIEFPISSGHRYYVRPRRNCGMSSWPSIVSLGRSSRARTRS